MTDITKVLEERGERYGLFNEHARITQNIKRAMQDSVNWIRLEDDMREALEMVAHKIGRILNGDPTYRDSWTDIEGYVALVERRLELDEIGRAAIEEREGEKARAVMSEPATLNGAVKAGEPA